MQLDNQCRNLEETRLDLNQGVHCSGSRLTNSRRGALLVILMGTSEGKEDAFQKIKDTVPTRWSCVIYSFPW